MPTPDQEPPPHKNGNIQLQDEEEIVDSARWTAHLSPTERPTVWNRKLAPTLKGCCLIDVVSSVKARTRTSTVPNQATLRIHSGNIPQFSTTNHTFIHVNTASSAEPPLRRIGSVAPGTASSRSAARIWTRGGPSAMEGMRGGAY